MSKTEQALRKRLAEIASDLNSSFLGMTNEEDLRIFQLQQEQTDIRKKLRSNARKRLAAQSIRDAYSDLGLKRVRGNMGGIYYE